MTLAGKGNNSTVATSFHPVQSHILHLKYLSRNTKSSTNLPSRTRLFENDEASLLFQERNLHQPLLFPSNNMKTAILASLVATAAAFTPAEQSARASVATNMAYEAELGAQPPLGFFDPLGIVKGASQARFDRLRAIEIKHGRICMLAIVGNLLPRAGITLPGNIDYAGHKFADYPPGVGAITPETGIPKEGLVSIILFIGFLELFIMKSYPDRGNEFPGDFRNGAIDWGWDSFTDAQKLQKRAIELNNGRAAMMGILGLMVHEQLGGVLPPIGEM